MANEDARLHGFGLVLPFQCEALGGETDDAELGGGALDRSQRLQEALGAGVPGVHDVAFLFHFGKAIWIATSA